MEFRRKKEGGFDQRFKKKDDHYDTTQARSWSKLLLFNFLTLFLLIFTTSGELTIIIFGIIVLSSFSRFIIIEYRRGAIEKIYVFIFLLLFAIGTLIIVSIAFPNMFTEDPDPSIIPGKILIDGVYY
tara:strand:- start:110 stop:490 length:381 start_codon:yes stop_codon:yes gene_type:complete